MMSFFKEYKGNKEFPITSPLKPQNIKFVTLKEISELKDCSSFYVWCENDAETSKFYCKFSNMPQLVRACEQLFSENKITSVIPFLQININTTIHNFHDFAEKVEAITKKKLYDLEKDPLRALFLNYVLLEAILPPNSLNDKNAFLFTAEQKKLICQGALQRIFRSLVTNEISPNLLYKSLTLTENEETTTNLLVSRVEPMHAAIYVKLRKKYELNDDSVTKKRDRIILTYCQYYVKYLRKAVNNAVFPLYFHNKSGMNFEITDKDNHVYLKQLKIAHFPAIFFEANPEYKNFCENYIIKLNTNPYLKDCFARGEMVPQEV